MENKINLYEQLKQMAYLSTNPFDEINYKNIIRLMKIEAKQGKYNVEIYNNILERQHEDNLTQYADKLKQEGFKIEYKIGESLKINWA